MMNSGGLQIPRWKISSKKSHWKILSQSCELGRIQLSFGLKYSSWNQVGRFEKKLELKCAKPGRQVNDGEWAGPKTLGPKGTSPGFKTTLYLPSLTGMKVRGVTWHHGLSEVSTEVRRTLEGIWVLIIGRKRWICWKMGFFGLFS